MVTSDRMDRSWIVVEIDPNVRMGHRETYVGFEDVIFGHPGQCKKGVEVLLGLENRKMGIVGIGHVTNVDFHKRLVWLYVDWPQLRAVLPPHPHPVMAKTDG